MPANRGDRMPLGWMRRNAFHPDWNWHDGSMDVDNRRSNPAAWWAFWVGLIGLVLMPIPLFIGLIVGGALGAIAAILAVIGLLKSRHTGGRGIGPAVFAIVFVVLTYGGISVGGGTIW